MLIYGINPILEALRAGRVSELRLSERGGARLVEVVKAADAAGVPVRRVERSELDRVTRGGVHQGVVADIREQAGLTLEALVAGPAPLIVVLDGIEDPSQRRRDSAERGRGRRCRRRSTIAPRRAARRSDGEGVCRCRRPRAGGGRCQHRRALEEFKGSGVWTVGLASDSDKRYDEIRLDAPIRDCRRRRPRPPASGPRAVRLAGVDSDVGTCSESECVGGDGHHVVRGGPPAASSRSASSG